jgi:hypothetical protein
MLLDLVGLFLEQPENKAAGSLLPVSQGQDFTNIVDGQAQETGPDHELHSFDISLVILTVTILLAVRWGQQAN